VTEVFGWGVWPVFQGFANVLMLDLFIGDRLPPPAPGYLLQINIWEMIGRGGPLTIAVLAVLLIFSIFSWAIIFSKWHTFRVAKAANARFLRAFRKATGLDAVMVASEQFKPAPLVSVFEFGYEEIHRQVAARGTVANKLTLERWRRFSSGYLKRLCQPGRRRTGPLHGPRSGSRRPRRLWPLHMDQ